MPALLGYLVAITVLISGGIIGLDWLTSPDPPTPSPRQVEKSSVAANRSARPEKPASVAASDPVVKPAPAEPATAALGDRSDATVAAKEPMGGGGPITQAPSAVPPGGCMPIGVTADGSTVFPLQCRELIERSRGSTAPIAPVPADKPTLPNETQPSTPAAAVESPAGSADGAASAPNEPASNPPADDRQAAKPSDDGGSKTAPDRPQEVAKTGDAKQVDAARPSSDVNTKKTTRLRNPARRSRLVLMTLETIEFYDGHREQRLVPYRGPRR